MKSIVALLVAVFVFTCTTNAQVVNGNWGAWTAYGSCSVTCGNGLSSKTRQCDNPPASGGGTPCPGDDTESKACWTTTCYPSHLGNLDNNCGGSYYGCVTGVVNCTAYSNRCDGVVHCSDGSDEDYSHAGCITTCSGTGTITVSVILMAFIAFTTMLLQNMKP